MPTTALPRINAPTSPQPAWSTAHPRGRSTTSQTTVAVRGQLRPCQRPRATSARPAANSSTKTLNITWLVVLKPASRAAARGKTTAKTAQPRACSPMIVAAASPGIPACPGGTFAGGMPSWVLTGCSQQHRLSGVPSRQAPEISRFWTLVTNFSRYAPEKRRNHLSGHDRICEAWNAPADNDVGQVCAHPAPPVSYTHLRAHETDSYLVCRLLLEKKK